MRQTVRPVKAECTGCGACASICPKKAITMQADAEGFLYPVVDAGLCVECDLCEKRCPVGRTQAQGKPVRFGAQHRDEAVRGASSSGGVFTALARQTLGAGGVVFGAAFDERMHVEHVGAFDEAELSGMRGSKYVQSDASDAIAHAASLLSRGIPVLFSGTPCQVAGLKAVVGDRYGELLLTVDFVCHGVPSPGVFASYLQALEREHGSRVTAYTFRDKRNGWKDFSAVATFEDGTEHVGSQVSDPFLYGFLQNLYLRPSCMQCNAYRGAGHQADITLADLWGAQRICPERDDDTGLSLVFVHTQRGREAFRRCGTQLSVFPIPASAVLERENPSIVRAVSAHPKRKAFFRQFAREGFSGARVMKLLAPPGRLARAAARVAHLPAGALRRLRACLRRP
ncbi:MAG: Coenzyme F420 hydrogenase/dehydrogenase, beta subunit C-terminal domain [Candidatus Ventricola sp.]